MRGREVPQGVKNGATCSWGRCLQILGENLFFGGKGKPIRAHAIRGKMKGRELSNVYKKRIFT